MAHRFNTERTAERAWHNAETAQVGAFHVITDDALRAEYDRAYREAWERYVWANECTPAGNDDEEWLHEQAQNARNRMRGLLI